VRGCRARRPRGRWRGSSGGSGARRRRQPPEAPPGTAQARVPRAERDGATPRAVDRTVDRIAERIVNAIVDRLFERLFTGSHEVTIGGAAPVVGSLRGAPLP